MARVQPSDFMAWQFLTHQIIHSRTIKVSEWSAQIYVISYIQEDGVIVVPRAYEFVAVYPNGLCECGACGAFWISNIDDPMYWDFMSLKIVCQDCIFGRHVQPMNMVHIHTSIVRQDPSVHILYEEPYDVRAAHEQAMDAAESFGLHYFLGKDAADLYHDMLGKRVIRRWRRMIRTNLVNRCMFVFSKKLGIDDDTCYELARRV